jgi:Zn-dependent protease
MLCHYCEQQKPGLPFRCNYCGEYFCSDHRLPENHACPRVGGPKQPGYSNVPSIQEKYVRGRFRSIPGISSPSRRFSLRYSGLFSRTEQKHVAVAALLVTLVGLSMDPFSFFGFAGIGPLFLTIVGFLIAFFGHEISHKFFAQRNGMWAEFRTNTYGLIFTAISIIVPFFKFIAPGHVNFLGQGSKETSGAIAIVGPGFNILSGFASLFVGFGLETIPGAGLYGIAFSIVALFNGYMALFNLIPFMGFDGLAAFEWDRTRWAIALVGSIALVIIALIR